MKNHEALQREIALLGEEAVEKLSRSTVMVFGIGGVGSYLCEALCRAGVGTIVVIDHDTVSESNCNRQLIADTTTLGMDKVQVQVERMKRIMPESNFIPVKAFCNAENIGALLQEYAPDYVADAIDTVASKLAIIEACQALSIPVLSSMGTGNKLDPTRFRITDITKTSVCPLARTMRRELKARGIAHTEVLWSDEVPSSAVTDHSHGRHAPASVSWVPSCAGLMIAGRIVLRLCEICP